MINKDCFKEEKKLCVEFTYEHEYGFTTEPVVDSKDFILIKQIREMIKEYYNKKLKELKKLYNLKNGGNGKW